MHVNADIRIARSYLSTMRTILLVLGLVACGGGSDPIEPGPDAAIDAEACASSTEPDTAPAWDACRAMNVDSWPVVCDAGEVPPPCVFMARTVDGADVLCRPAGACE